MMFSCGSFELPNFRVCLLRRIEKQDGELNYRQQPGVDTLVVLFDGVFAVLDGDTEIRFVREPRFEGSSAHDPRFRRFVVLAPGSVEAESIVLDGPFADGREVVEDVGVVVRGGDVGHVAQVQIAADPRALLVQHADALDVSKPHRNVEAELHTAVDVEAVAHVAALVRQETHDLRVAVLAATQIGVALPSSASG
eukprot:CAMPEP_0198670708 /NCGR_PEP_ID=MMETSP1467-20131203/82429_1 /TAXON_ID=1462469 /ORGANISM="unid. sp., Strain CCMP2135" /LENGTH=194 /DNA_ID=CAMNT_0044407491 /DNA_START=251 /DNA_END=837 /DNA_ORIENTATION=-